MSLRKWVSNHPKLGIVAAVVLLLVVGRQIVYGVLGSRQTISLRAPDVYGSIDDGKTFFIAPGDSIPPFDHEGQPAVRAYVFQSGGHRFVGYLERFTPDVRQAILSGKPVSQSVMSRGREVKKPGDTKWISCGDLIAVGKVISVDSTGGSTDQPVPVEP